MSLHHLCSDLGPGKVLLRRIHIYLDTSLCIIEAEARRRQGATDELLVPLEVHLGTTTDALQLLEAP